MWKKITKASGAFQLLTYRQYQKKTIIYYSGDPANKLGKIYDELIAQGLRFSTIFDIKENIDSSSLFIQGKVAGYYCQDLNAYDALVNLHFAQAAGKRIYSGGPDGLLNLSNIQKRVSGFYYPGYYLALN